MTDRYNSFTVILDDAIRDDDAECVITALRMVKGVARVVPSADCSIDVIARSQLRSKMRRQLYDAIDSVFEPERGT